MCTIGAFFNNEHTISFKQCDLIKPTLFYAPEILDGINGIRYTKFGREGNTRSWCGINNFGVSFSAADSYLKKSVTPIVTERSNEVDIEKITEFKRLLIHSS